MFKNKNRPGIRKMNGLRAWVPVSISLYFCNMGLWSLSRTEIPGESDIELFCVTLYLCTAKPGDTGQGHGDSHIIR